MNKQQAEKIEKNALIFEEKLKKHCYYNGLDKVFNKIGTAFYVAPASSRDEYHYCYPGGLVEHSIDVADRLLKLSNSAFPNRYVDNRLITLALIHDIGKAGDGENDLYLWKDSAWHQERGLKYELNPKCNKMTTQDRTLFLLQSFGINLESDDYLALKLCEVKAEEIPEVYRYNEPTISLLLNTANKLSINESN